MAGWLSGRGISEDTFPDPAQKRREKFEKRKIEEAPDKQIAFFQSEVTKQLFNLKDAWTELDKFVWDHIVRHGSVFWQCLPPGFWVELNPTMSKRNNSLYEQFHVLRELCQKAEWWELDDLELRNFRDACLLRMVQFNLTDGILAQWKTIYESNLVPFGLVWQLSFYIANLHLYQQVIKTK